MGSAYDTAGVSDGNIIASGNVGIGTTGPDRKLDVLDASNPQLRLSQADGTVYSDFQMTSAGDLVMNIDGVSNQLVLDNGGNVGIGRTDPGEKLHVYGGNIEIENNDANNYIKFYDTMDRVVTVGIKTNPFLSSTASLSKTSQRPPA